MNSRIMRLNRDAKMFLMETDTNERTKKMSKQIPYHLQYIREGKPVIKPDKEVETTNEEDRTY